LRAVLFAERRLHPSRIDFNRLDVLQPCGNSDGHRGRGDVSNRGALLGPARGVVNNQNDNGIGTGHQRSHPEVGRRLDRKLNRATASDHRPGRPNLGPQYAHFPPQGLTARIVATDTVRIVVWGVPPVRQARRAGRQGIKDLDPLLHRRAEAERVFFAVVAHTIENDVQRPRSARPSTDRCHAVNVCRLLEVLHLLGTLAQGRFQRGTVVGVGTHHVRELGVHVVVLGLVRVIDIEQNRRNGVFRADLLGSLHQRLAERTEPHIGFKKADGVIMGIGLIKQEEVHRLASVARPVGHHANAGAPAVGAALLAEHEIDHVLGNRLHEQVDVVGLHVLEEVIGPLARRVALVDVAPHPIPEFVGRRP